MISNFRKTEEFPCPNLRIYIPCGYWLTSICNSGTSVTSDWNRIPVTANKVTLVSGGRFFNHTSSFAGLGNTSTSLSCSWIPVTDVELSPEQIDELEEIENAINTIDIIKESAVVYKRLNNSYGKIIAYAVSERDIGVNEIKNQLKQQIPAYMIPSKIIFMEVLPKNANGKIDRKQLKHSK